MEPEVFLRRVLALQASIRGFLVRRHFQSLRAEYEAVVREIEGDLGKLQWSEGWIPRPRFLPEKTKPHYPWEAEERIPSPKQELWSHCLRKEYEKEATWEEVVLRKSEGSSGKPGSLPCRRDNGWLEAEQDRKASQGKTRNIPISKVENPATGPGLSQNQQEFRELQYQRNHLAMELLWLQQAINSRKEYLLLKQTLRSAEADQTRDKPDKCLGQTCEKTCSQPSCLQEDQSYGDRTTGEPDHADDSHQEDISQPHKSSENLATTDQTTAEAKSRKPCCRKAKPQPPTASDVQAGGDRFTKVPDHGGQTFKRTCLQQMKLEDQPPGGLKPKSPCSGKAKTQLPTLCEAQNTENKSPRKPKYKEVDCQRANPLNLSISEGHMTWDGTLAGLEHGSLDLRKTQLPKGQTPNDRSSSHRTSNELSHEGWESHRTVPWR